MEDFPRESASRLIDLALDEDVRSGDVTCQLCVPSGHRSLARVVSKQDGIFAGVPLAALVLKRLGRLDPLAHEVCCLARIADGEAFSAGRVLLELEGPTRAILEAERTLLNFLQHLCGVALSARRHQDAAGPGCRVLDTRKTTPGQRALEKWAILQGGGSNHRLGLWDTVLIKENHAASAGSIRAAAQRALEGRGSPDLPVIAEVRDLDELASLLDLPLERVLLDNFPPALVTEARRRRDEAGASFGLEASGGITLATLPTYAAAGAEFVSIGAMTHSVMPVDLSLLLEGT